MRPPGIASIGSGGAATAWSVALAGAATGRRTMKAVPWPSPRLTTSTVPACSSTIDRVIARPRPSPGGPAVAWGPCQNGSKMWAA